MPRVFRSTPAYDPLFESPWLKWRQAMDHAAELDREMNAWITPGQAVCSFRLDYQASRHGFVVTAEHVQPVPARWGLILGDVANNYRSALHHLAWALVSRGSTPPRDLTAAQQRAIYFPITNDPKTFNDEILKPTSKARPKLPGVRRADSAIVRTAQPFQVRVSKRPIHPLVMLNEINTGDRHRTIQPIWTLPELIHFHVDKGEDFALSGVIHKGATKVLRDGEEVAVLPGKRTGPRPHLDVNIGVAATASVGKRVPL